MTLLDAALHYAERGWPVFPLEPTTIGVKNSGKRPLGQLVPHGLKDATTDAERIRRWWTAHPNANIGTPTGYVFDACDLDDDQAVEGFAHSCSAHGIDARDLPRTKTGSGGRHVLFAPTGQGNRGDRKAESFMGGRAHWRGAGGYVVLPPSVHWSGKTYEWIVEPNGHGFPPAPDWITEQLRARASEPADAESAPGPAPNRYIEAAVTDEMSKLRSAPVGNRNNQLNDSAFALGQMVGAGWITRGHAEAELKAACYAIDHHHEPGMSATIRSGLEAGIKHPRAAIEGNAPGPARETAPPAPPLDEENADEADQVAVAPDGYRLTDHGNALRLVKHAKGTIRYVHAWGKWLVYRDGRWTIDQGDALITDQAHAVARSLFALVATLDGKERDQVFAAAKRAETSGGVAGMINLARGMQGVIVEHEELDADPYVLNVRNGLVDLRTGRLLPHSPKHLSTQQCPVAYDPKAKAPLWEACLERWQPDPGVREYLHREAGAGATGSATETVSVHYGTGNNGKSKFFGALQRVLGPYAVVPDKSLLVVTYQEQHATVRASLFRARLAVASETSAAARLNEDTLKNLTGGDRIRARRMREDEWSFWPTHTLALFSNHKPAVAGRDEGIWRRLRLVPWLVTIPEDERDPDLAAKLDAEAVGILRWVVDGAQRFLDEGFKPPAAVRAATDGYRADTDTVGRFLADNGLVFEPDGVMIAADLSLLHEAWCEENGERHLAHWKLVAKRFRDAGAKPGWRDRQRVWFGVCNGCNASPRLHVDARTQPDYAEKVLQPLRAVAVSSNPPCPACGKDSAPAEPDGFWCPNCFHRWGQSQQEVS